MIIVEMIYWEERIQCRLSLTISFGNSYIIFPLSFL